MPERAVFVGGEVEQITIIESLSPNDFVSWAGSPVCEMLKVEVVWWITNTKLTVDQRGVLTLHVIHGQSVTDIADAMKTSKPAVSRMIKRATIAVDKAMLNWKQLGLRPPGLLTTLVELFGWSAVRDVIRDM